MNAHYVDGQIFRVGEIELLSGGRFDPQPGVPLCAVGFEGNAVTGLFAPGVMTGLKLFFHLRQVVLRQADRTEEQQGENPFDRNLHLSVFPVDFWGQWVF